MAYNNFHNDIISLTKILRMTHCVHYLTNASFLMPVRYYLELFPFAHTLLQGYMKNQIRYLNLAIIIILLDNIIA